MFQVSIKLVLKVIQIPRSTYYYAKEHRGRESNDAQIIQAIDEIRQQDPKYTRKYGYRRITEALRNNYGFKINHKRVLRIMREQNWLCQAYNRQKRKYNSYKGTVGVIAPNRFKRRFKTDRPYQKLVIDVSEFRYGNKSQSERVYLEPVLDLYNGEVLAFNISDHPTVDFALKPLKEALENLPSLGYRTTVHTDQGFQYQNRRWRNMLKTHRVFQSMSRKATCLDNAAMESFFHIMKVEVMDEQFKTKNELIRAMTEWIDFYNHRRIKTKLDGKSPVKYRELAIQKAA